MKFEKYNIAITVKKALKEAGFKRPTDIQYKAIKHIMKGEDVLAIAQTGTGKTAAFVIPILHQLELTPRRQEKGFAPQAVVMAPTHELAMQIEEVFKQLGRYSKVVSLAIYGGVEQDSQIAGLQQGVDVIIATPGRLFDLQAQGHLNLKEVKTLVLDEADHMLKLGFYEDIQDLLARLPRKRQTLFFSATIDDKIKKLAYSLVHKPIRIQISPKNPVNTNIDHGIVFVEMEEKRFFLERMILENPASKILVFVRTKVRAERVANALERAKIASKTIHSDKRQQNRSKILDDFRTGNTLVLIATDVGARGIDIPNVDYVINYDLPDVAENYVHRVGRTGRAQQRGKAVAFCSPREMELLAAIEEFIGEPVQELDVSDEEREMTIDLSETNTRGIKDALKLIEEHEQGKKNKRKKKK